MLLRLSVMALASVSLGLLYRIKLDDDILWMIGTYPFVLYAFVPGMILAVVELRHPARFRQLGGHLSGAVGAVLLALGCVTMADPIALPTGIGTMLVMAWLIEHRVPAARALAFAGGASYAMYLWHRDLFTSFGVFGVVIAAVGSALSWAIVERPILDWAHRVAARWRRTTAPDESAVVAEPVAT
jgi:peptidoglycan/LPS O-acetylase OafA/YrhL